MQLIRITALIRNIFDRLICDPQKLCGACKPLFDQKLLRRTACQFLKTTTEIIAVQFAKIRHLIHRQLSLVILLDIDNRFMNIVILSLFFIRFPAVCVILNPLKR